MVTVREHRGSLEDSLRTLFAVESRAALVSRINRALKPFGAGVSDEQVTIEPYARDARMPGWENSHIITVQGYGVYGFSSAHIS